MQIVINIDEEVYEKIQKRKVNQYDIDDICQSVFEGTPLPKGALITKGQAVELVEFYKLNPQHFSFDNLIDDIHNEKPIIEADRSEEE